MPIEAAASAQCSPRNCAASRPRKATTSPSIAALSSKSTVKTVGSLDRRTSARMLRLPRMRLNARQAIVQATPSKIMASPSTT